MRSMKRLNKVVVLVVAAGLLAGCESLSKKKPGKAPTGKPVAGAPAAPSKGDAQARFAQALQLMKEKKPEAETAFISLANDFPQYSGPLTNLGIIYAKSNRRDQAMLVLTKATVANGKNAVAWNWLGMMQREGGSAAAAERSYLQALQAKPDYGLAHLNLGILYDNYLGRPADALVHYRQYQQGTGRNDLRIAAWIAEIESRQIVSKPLTAPAATAAQPTLAKPREEPKGSLLPVRKP
jgi:tetratricopeptide (TPR) repeat protein